MSACNCNKYKELLKFNFPARSQVLYTYRWLVAITPNDNLKPFLNLTLVRRHFCIQITENLKKTFENKPYLQIVIVFEK